MEELDKYQGFTCEDCKYYNDKAHMGDCHCTLIYFCEKGEYFELKEEAGND